MKTARMLYCHYCGTTLLAQNKPQLLTPNQLQSIPRWRRDEAACIPKPDGIALAVPAYRGEDRNSGLRDRHLRTARSSCLVGEQRISDDLN